MVWTVTYLGVEAYGKYTPQEILLTYLNDFRPAVTVFKWFYGEDAYPELKEIEQTYAPRVIMPATGFDNGAMIFHASVVDFFIPCYLGNDFKPGFTIQHPYLNLMIPFMYTSHAIKFAGITYYNPPSEVRHTYQVDETVRFTKHLASRFKCKHRRWGPMLRLQDLTWEPKRGSPPYKVDPIMAISSFFDVHDSMIQSHPLTQKLGWSNVLLSTQSHIDRQYIPCITDHLELI
jgi:hypothetical protein